MTEQDPKITTVSISRDYHGAYSCDISIDYIYGEVKLKLPEDRVQQIISVVADLIVDGARGVAERLTKQAMDVKAIEHQPDQQNP